MSHWVGTVLPRLSVANAVSNYPLINLALTWYLIVKCFWFSEKLSSNVGYYHYHPLFTESSVIPCVSWVFGFFSQFIPINIYGGDIWLLAPWRMVVRLERLILWLEHWDIETWTWCLSFEHKKYKETNQLALQASVEEARDMWLSYIMMRKSKEILSSGWRNRVTALGIWP